MAKANVSKANVSKANVSKANNATVVAREKLGVKVPHYNTVRKLEKAAHMADGKLATRDNGAYLHMRTQHAIDCVNSFTKISGSRTIFTGKNGDIEVSPLGHKAQCQNGQFDIAIIRACQAGKLDLSEIVKQVVLAGCSSRKSMLTDNKAFVKRLVSHTAFLSGSKSTATASSGMPKRLRKVGKEQYVNECYAAYKPLYELFKSWYESGKF